MSSQPFNLDIPKMGYFILYKNDKTFIGNQIEKYQLKCGFPEKDACYTHVEVSWGGEMSVCVSPPYIRIVDITRKYKGRYIKIVRYDNEDYEQRTRKKVALWATSNCNKPYDFFGVLAFKIKIIFSPLAAIFNRVFCSENSLWALQKEHPKAMNFLKPSQCMPAHFSCYCKAVWEGVIPGGKS